MDAASFSAFVEAANIVVTNATQDMVRRIAELEGENARLKARHKIMIREVLDELEQGNGLVIRICHVPGELAAQYMSHTGNAVSLILQTGPREMQIPFMDITTLKVLPYNVDFRFEQ